MNNKSYSNSLWATIYTDASGTGGWAAWIRCKLPPYKLTIKGTHDLTDSTAFEAFAVLEAVKATVNQWNDVDGLHIVTDSQSAIIMLKKKHHKNKIRRNIRNKFSQITTGRRIRFVWKKGHCKDNSVSTWVNNWCDKNSRINKSK